MTVVLLAAALVLVFRGELAGWLAGDHGAAISSAPTTFYTCPMDPSVESDHPGTCPICGMALTAVTQQERNSGVVRVATKARSLIGLDVARVHKMTLSKHIVASGEVVEPAPAADRPRVSARGGAALGPERSEITARVYRGAASEAHPGDPVTVTARDLALAQFAGTVVESAADAAGTLRVVVENPEKLLRPGMRVEVKLDAELPPCLAVPSAAVLYAGKRRLVFVERSKGVFEPRTPTLGISSDGLVEIVSGLHEGDQVAISGTFLLAAESRIRSDGTLWGERPEPAPVKPVPVKPALVRPTPPNTPSPPSNGRP
jgi:hypothetical protein